MEIDRAALLMANDERARAQLDRMRAVAKDFQPTAKPRTHRRRVLVTAFGRFPPHATNATARLARALLDQPFRPSALPVHLSDAGEGSQEGGKGGRGGDPWEHLRWIEGVMGGVELHVVVLPVMWDLAALVALRVIDATKPDLVLMNGIGSAKQAIAFEAEASNRCASRDDVSTVIRPQNEKILPHVDEQRRAMHFDFERALAVARKIIPSVEVAPGRDDNAYLCNQLAYLVDRAMDNPDRTLRLLRATDDDEGIDVQVNDSLRDTPRAFIHWPSDIVDDAPCISLLRALITDRA